MFHRTKPTITIVAALALAGCSSTIYRKGALADVQTLSIDAKQRLIISGIRRSDKRRVTCAEPSPDALVAQAAILSSSGRIPVNGSNASAGLSFGSQESAASIGLRTQSIQILRDGYYRLCEAYLNDAIGPREYKEVLYNLDTFINVALAIDGLGNAKAAPNVAIGSSEIKVGGSSGTAESGASTSGSIAGTAPQFKDVIASGHNQATTPIAVAQIVRDYLNYKEDRTCDKETLPCDRLVNSDFLKEAAPK